MSSLILFYISVDFFLKEHYVTRKKYNIEQFIVLFTGIQSNESQVMIHVMMQSSQVNHHYTVNMTHGIIRIIIVIMQLHYKLYYCSLVWKFPLSPRVVAEMLRAQYHLR